MPSRSSFVNTFQSESKPDPTPPASMIFKVGAWEWTVTIARSLYYEGDWCLGKAILSTRQIKICADIPPARRLSVLLHELRHAWQWDVPRPKDDEEECDLFAMACAATWADLNAQGGESALREMIVAETVPTARLLQRWYGFATDLDDPAVELTADEFAPIAETFRELKFRGHPFDPTLISLMRVLELQMGESTPE